MDEALYMTHIRQGNIEFSRFKNLSISLVYCCEVPCHRLWQSAQAKYSWEKYRQKNLCFAQN